MVERHSPEDQPKSLPVAPVAAVALDAAPPPAKSDAPDESGPPAPSRRAWTQIVLRNTPSWLVSMVVHMVVLIVLALASLPEGVTDELQQLVLAPDETEELDNLDEPDDFQTPEEIDVTADLMAVESLIEPLEVEVPGEANDLEAAPTTIELNQFAFNRAEQSELLSVVGTYAGSDLAGRGEAARARLVREGGGTEASEAAVAAALRWLAEHQFGDGGWSFDHTRAPNCGGQCRNPGTMDEARIAATAMALLPMLGAGQTQKSGDYKKVVQNGLYFLKTRMRLTPEGGNMWEPDGRMYSHGLASIVLCEAYAMTQDSGLREPAQKAVDFIVYAQDPVGGGWRYDPRQAGDTSVVGWQMMALTSAHMAYLQVPGQVTKRLGLFLDSLQSDSGATYGYTRLDPRAKPSTTSIGLLCRMYLGWKKENPALQRGVRWLSDLGPSKDDMYYNYYATQIMRHWEGSEWEKWNGVMRDQLVNSQATRGHEKGSWFVPGDPHGANPGGRLYCTSMAAMILEVYYRHLPIYRKQSTEAGFPE